MLFFFAIGATSLTIEQIRTILGIVTALSFGILLVWLLLDIFKIFLEFEDNSKLKEHYGID
jgi:hypothetical protein